LAAAGIRDVVLVTGAEIDQFNELLGNGSELDVSIRYARQEGELGIADALGKVESFTRADKLVVVLGDNIFQENLAPFVRDFVEQHQGARLLLKRVAREDAMRFGVATVDQDRIVRVVEKPSSPESDLVVTGCYMFDRSVFDIIRGLTLSDRGEYEITDVNNAYIERNQMAFNLLSGWWTDAGTPPSKLKASILVALNKGVTFHA
jgi:glucose-1-phosphate thymidylyltransferase